MRGDYIHSTKKESYACVSLMSQYPTYSKPLPEKAQEYSRGTSSQQPIGYQHLQGHQQPTPYQQSHGPPHGADPTLWTYFIGISISVYNLTSGVDANQSGAIDTYELQIAEKW